MFLNLADGNMERVQNGGHDPHLPAGQWISGFTLLEILVSLSIIALVLLAVFRLHSQTLTMNQEAGFFTTAPFLANVKMAEIEAAFPEIPQNETGYFGDEYPGYSWKLAVTDVTSDSLEETAKDLKQLDMTVALNDGERSFHLKAYRFIR